MTYDATILAMSPTAFWPLSEANGSGTVADATGNGHTGTVGSGVSLGAASLLSADAATAATFPGANDSTGRITMTYSSAFQTTDKATVVAWYKPSSFGNARVFNAGVGGSDGFAVGIDSSGFLKVTAYNVADIPSTYQLTIGTKYTLGYVFDVTAGHVYFYANGVLVDTQPLARLNAALSTITIGNSANGSESGISGVMQKVSVWIGTALTGTDMANIHNAGSSSPQHLSGEIDDATVLSGTLLVSHLLAGEIDATTSCSALLTVGHHLSGEIDWATSLSGTLFSSVIPGTAILSATTTSTATLSAASTATATLAVTSTATATLGATHE